MSDSSLNSSVCDCCRVFAVNDNGEVEEQGGGREKRNKGAKEKKGEGKKGEKKKEEQREKIQKYQKFGLRVLKSK